MCRRNAKRRQRFGISRHQTQQSAGRPLVVIHGNGARVTQAFDAANRVTLQVHADGIGACRRTTFSYDGANRRIVAAASDGTRTSWTFDAAGQLAREWRSGSESFTTTFIWDPVGNHTLRNDSGTRTSSTFDVANQLLVANTSGSRTTYEHDGCGNRILAQTGSGRTRLSWDPCNRLAWADPGACRVCFGYDPLDPHMQPQAPGGNTQYVFDFERLLRETDGVGRFGARGATPWARRPHFRRRPRADGDLVRRSRSLGRE